MYEKVLGKYYEYCRKKREQCDKRKGIAAKLVINYENLMKLSDDELKINSCNGVSLEISGIKFPDAVLKTSVGNKLRYYVGLNNINVAGDRLEIEEYLTEKYSSLVNKMINRTMKKEEYEQINSWPMI